MARTGGTSRPGNFGRGLLASSHAGTRLPIAAGTPPPAGPAYVSGPDAGRSPSVRSRPAAGAPVLVLFASFAKTQKARRTAERGPPSKAVMNRLPTAALPASGVRTCIHNRWTPYEGPFSRHTASIFLKIRQDSCGKFPCPAGKILAHPASPGYEYRF